MIEILAVFAVVLGCCGLIVMAAWGADRLSKRHERERDRDE